MSFLHMYESTMQFWLAGGNHDNSSNVVIFTCDSTIAILAKFGQLVAYHGVSPSQKCWSIADRKNGGTAERARCVTVNGMGSKFPLTTDSPEPPLPCRRWVSLPKSQGNPYIVNYRYLSLLASIISKFIRFPVVIFQRIQGTSHP